MLIFLDIDGVMVPAKSWKAPELLSDGFAAFSGRATTVLRQLVAEGGTVVLTSSHKSNHSKAEWKEIFRLRGIALENLLVLDPNSGGLSRKDEILQWMRLHMVDDRFVILDDDKSLNGLPPSLKQKLILTDSLVGLTEHHLDSVRAAADVAGAWRI